MAKILIIGANSFIGINFIKYSKFSDIDQISLLDISPENINFSKYDTVLHLAAIVHQSNKIPDSEYIRVNRDLCLHVANLSKKAGVRQFVFMSTLKVNGENQSKSNLRNENSTCYPDDIYGISKYEAEVGLKKIEDPDFVVSIVRPPLIYGEGVKANMLNLIKLVEHFRVLPFGGISNKRNFAYIENLVGYIDRIIEYKAAGIFIAMDDTAISTTELVNYISKYMNRKVLLIRLPDVVIKIGSRVLPRFFKSLYSSMEFDNSQTRMQLDFNAPITIEEGLRRTIKIYMIEKDCSL